MITFKQFIAEGAQRRTIDGILYSGPSEFLVADVMQLHDDLKKVVSDLKLEKRFKDAHIHAALYVHGQNDRLLNLKVPVPNGISGEAVVTFLRLASISIEKRIAHPFKIMLSTKSRAFISKDEIVAHISRRQKQETDGDKLDVDIIIPKDRLA